MFNVDDEDIQIIFKVFNELNDVLNDEIKLKIQLILLKQHI